MPTLQDIARAAGVSQSTVSRVLNSSSSSIPIGEKTRQRVLSAADRLNYEPNPFARLLKGARTMLLGVIVRELPDPFFGAAIEAIAVEARARSYSLVLGHAHSQAEEAIALRTIMETRQVDAILVVGDVSNEAALVDDLRETRVPVVALWQGSALPGISSVVVDNRFGTRALVDHLLELGHRRVGVIGGERARSANILARRESVVDRLREAGIETPAPFLQDSTNDPGDAAQAMRLLLAQPVRPTAVVCSTDVQAIGALHAAFACGLRVPEDISIVGFDDIPMASYTVPGLTTSRIPIAEMAAIAVGIALDVEDGQAASREAVTFQRPLLVLRGSSGPAPRADPAP
jgi:DNA-binding LacI/PurR family transcriptional regulator